MNIQVDRPDIKCGSVRCYETNTNSCKVEKGVLYVPHVQDVVDIHKQ